MNQIRDAAYDAEDVIDEFIVRLEHQRQRRLQNLNDPGVKGHFQVYTIRELLMGIANNVMPETDHMCNMGENPLGNEVRKYLDDSLPMTLKTFLNI